MDGGGTVYFFTGLSGAGKTTLGELFYKRLKQRKPNVVFLDGDRNRPVFCEDIGYSAAERLKAAYRGGRVCKMLAEQDIDVVHCTIAMYNEIRQWYRENIAHYIEIYVRAGKETLLARNQKGLYTGGKNIVGIDLPFDEPQHSDLIIQNDGEQTPLAVVEGIEAALWGQEGGRA